MIFFPFLYDDELLYSAFARYHKYSGNEDNKDTMYELFGSKNACATIHPLYLNNLCERFPLPYFYNSDELIDKHTLLPYYSAFLTKERHEDLREELKHGKGASFRIKLGNTSSKVKRPNFLKFCIRCVEYERNNYGESYWHRSHQLEGVILCPTHLCRLNDSEVMYVEKKTKQKFVTLDDALLFNNFPNENNHNEILSNGLAEYISQQSCFLLNNKFDYLEISEVRDFYYKMLSIKGYIMKSGFVKYKELVAHFNNFYGEKFLSSINCLIPLDMTDTWLREILRKNPRTPSHPLRHILLLGFLEESVLTMIDTLESRDKYNQLDKIKDGKKVNKSIVLENIDWCKRDEEISKQIKLIVSTILQEIVNPQRVTKNEIGRRLGNTSVLYKHKEKLPKTHVVLAQVYETVEQFHIRKMRIIASKNENLNKSTNYWEIVRLAGIGTKAGQKIKHVILG